MTKQQIKKGFRALAIAGAPIVLCVAFYFCKQQTETTYQSVGGIGFVSHISDGLAATQAGAITAAYAIVVLLLGWVARSFMPDAKPTD